MGGGRTELRIELHHFLVTGEVEMEGLTPGTSGATLPGDMVCGSSPADEEDPPVGLLHDKETLCFLSPSDLHLLHPHAVPH